jgi:hypothetical protein
VIAPAALLAQTEDESIAALDDTPPRTWWTAASRASSSGQVRNMPAGPPPAPAGLLFR